MNAASCLIAVDIQKGFLTDLSADLPARIRDFCLGPGKSIEHKIFTRFVNPGPGHNWHELLGWERMAKSSVEIELTDEVRDLPDLVIDKFSYSPFLETKLEHTLRELDVRTVLVCGMDTDVCVLTTAFALFDLGFHPIVVKDLCVSRRSAELHEAALKVMPRGIGKENIRTVSQLLAQ